VFTPQLPIALRVHQIAADGEIISVLHNSPGQHGTHTQLTAYCSRIDVFAFVSKSRTARGNPKVGQLGETIDNALGNAFAQVIGVTIPPPPSFSTMR